MARPIPVADLAIATAALRQIVEIFNESGLDQTMTFDEFLLECASKVKFQPSTRQLILTFDLATGADQPDPTNTPD